MSMSTPPQAPAAAPIAAPVARGWTGSLARRTNASATSGPVDKSNVAKRQATCWRIVPAPWRTSGQPIVQPITHAKIAGADASAKTTTTMRARPSIVLPRDSPTTEVAIRRGFWQDLYLVLPATDPAMMAAQTATLQIVVNPLVNWIWLGFGVIAFGTGIALLPERAYSFAVAKSGSDVAGATATLLLIIFLASTPVFAQMHDPSAQNAPVGTASELEKQMRREMVCICGELARLPSRKATSCASV